MQTITAGPLTRETFAPFGTVIEREGAESFLINRGKCRRHHALARADLADSDGDVVLSIFSGTPYALPLTVDLVECHPLGSQAFFPLQDRDWLVIVCENDGDGPGTPHAFVARGNQGVQYPPGRWHGVLAPIHEPAEFLVMDRDGPGDNLREVVLAEPFRVELP